MKILLVDDQKSTRGMIKSIVESMKHSVVEATDGVEAIKAFNDEKPDLVLMDVEMPNMDGYEAVERIRKASSKNDWVPIIFLSGNSSDDDVLKGIRSGGDDFLFKPVSEKLLKAKMYSMARISAMRNKLITLTDQLNNNNKKLTTEVTRDALTGLASRRFYDLYLSQEWNKAVADGTPISMLLCDIDKFKLYNDHYGHKDGDTCLQAVAAAMPKVFRRPTDVCARYGGEEFTVILPNTPHQVAPIMAERLRKAVETLALEHKGVAEDSVVTLSIGVATIIPTEKDSPDDFVVSVDQELYKAKENGRNQISTLK